MKLVKPLVRVIDANRVVENVERGGRLCYKSEDKIAPGTAAAFCEKMKSFKHLSTFEHAVITVQILTDRGVTHELVRHRLAAYSQESTRYCNYSKNRFGGEISALEPFFFDPREEPRDVFVPSVSDELGRVSLADSSRAFKLNAFDVWFLTCLWAEWGYSQLTQVFGRSAQEARGVLPNSLKTEIQVTANAREWIHIFQLRTHRDAHPQIRQIMVPLARAFAERWPALFSEFKDCDKIDKSAEAEIIWEI